MERYESYKDSGVKWIGEIPGHWEVKRLGSYFTERRVKVSDKDFAPLSVTKNGIFPQLENVAKTNDGDNRKLVKENDFVINSRSDRKGSSGVSSFDGSVSLINIVLKPRKTIYSPFCNYLLKSIAFIEEFYRNGRGIVADLWTTRYDEMKIVKMAMPTLSEQTAIANYLDSVTSKIDEAISQQQKMIDLLNERKQIIIQNAVTKGLDPNVKMKDSGVEWIGEIPEDWGMNKLKYLFKLNKKKNVGNKCNTILSLSYGKIKIKKDLNEGLSPESYEGYQLLNEGDIVIRSTDLQNDHTSLRTGLVKCEGAITNAYIGLKNLDIKKYDSRYYHYFLHDWDISKAIYNQGKGLRQSLNWDDIKNMLLPVLDINEQTAIANYLDTITSKIDATISQQQKMIGLLNERKQIIINDVVTGKVKVV